MKQNIKLWQFGGFVFFGAWLWLRTFLKCKTPFYLNSKL